MIKPIAILFFMSCCLAWVTQHKRGTIRNIQFHKVVLSTEFISEGVAVTDVNKDGMMDVLAGTFWWQAPEWTRHEITTPYIHPSIDGYSNSFLNFTMDVNQDGWDDLIKIGFPAKEAFWYENPKGRAGYWKERVVYPSVGNESPAFEDVDGDGRKDLICNDPINRRVIWVSSPREKYDTVWTTYIISNDTLRGTHLFTHGLGFGDINKDGRKDVISREGWWEAPFDRKRTRWKFHPADLGPACAQMYAIDLDNDGDNDVISSSAHNVGIWWHEQSKLKNRVTWKMHTIFNEFSQSHGLAMQDINNDGHPDLVTGNRFWAHNGHDPGDREPAVLYWFEYKPGKTPKWDAHLIDNDSGVGVQVVIADMNKDKKQDIVIANKKGVFVFEQKTTGEVGH